jgi:hypothetical protein
MQTETYALAPTAGVFKIMTNVVLAVPALLLFVAFATLFGGDAARAVSIGSTAGFMMFVYVVVWVYYRPTRFELTGEGLLIRWPLRTRVYPYAKLGKPEVVSYDTFKSRHGRGMRVGAGGLWGGFGLLVCKNTTFNFYISRLDDIVLATAEPRPLMITPERAAEFVKALSARLK